MRSSTKRPSSPASPPARPGAATTMWDAGLRFEKEFGHVKVEAGIAYMREHRQRRRTARPTVAPLATSTPTGQLGVPGHWRLDQRHGREVRCLRQLRCRRDVGRHRRLRLRPSPAPASTTPTSSGPPKSASSRSGTTSARRRCSASTTSTTVAASRQTVNAARPDQSLGGNAQIFSSEVDMWGLGVMQKIDAADMKLYALYRHYEFDLELARGRRGDGLGPARGLPGPDDGCRDQLLSLTQLTRAERAAPHRAALLFAANLRFWTGETGVNHDQGGWGPC